MQENSKSAGEAGEPEAFACAMCGHCCEGSGGIVVSRRDLARLCMFLELTPEEFERRWCERHGGKLHVRAGESGACVFFEKETGCGVHAAKPDICRAWPYFRGNLVDSRSLAWAREFCPGIPRDCSHEDFVRLGLKCLEREDIVGRGGADEAGALQVRDIQERLGKPDS